MLRHAIQRHDHPHSNYLLISTGDGHPWPGRIAGASAQPEVFANEMEFVRQIFPRDQFADLHGIFDVCDHLCIAIDGRCESRHERYSIAGK